MLLQTILNRVEPFKSFTYGKVRLVEDAEQKTIEVEVHARMDSRAVDTAAIVGGRVTIGCRSGGSSSCPCGEWPCFLCMPCGGWTAGVVA